MERERPPTFAINSGFELPNMSETSKRAMGVDARRAEPLHRRDNFARGFTEEMMMYALGRGLVISVDRRIEAATAALKKNYHLHALLRAIVQSTAFHTG